MNIKKLIMLLILLVAVIGFTLTPVTSKNVKIYFKEQNTGVDKSIGGEDYVTAYYYHKQMELLTHSKGDIVPNSHYITKAKVVFKKKVNGKNKYATQTFKADKYGTISYKTKNNYKPYYATVTYVKENRDYLNY